LKLLETLRLLAPRTTLVYASSATVYGEGVTNPVRETDQKTPASPYGASKLACEIYVRLYAELYALPTVIGCLFSVFGPRLRKQIVWDIMKKLAADPQRLPLFGDGSQVRDFSYVSNVCDALVLLAERAPKLGERYNIASGAPVSVAELARAICTEFGCAPMLDYSGSVRPGETQSWYPDVSAVRELGYVPQIELQAGIARTVNWFLAEHPLPLQK
jgi:nucleoside-diphosphate-sugar epimerase